MTFPHASRRGEGRLAWPRVVAVAWMACLSAAAVVGFTELSRLNDPRRAVAQDTHLQKLTERVSDLERQAEAAKQQPKPATPSDVDALRKTLDDRLAALDQAQAAGASKDDLQAVQTRLNAIEARLKGPLPPARPSPAALARKAVAVARETVLDPPFRVVGLELRSGVRFLVLAPIASNALADTRLLREGGSDGPWQLQAIDGHVAVFRFADQTLRVAIP